MELLQQIRAGKAAAFKPNPANTILCEGPLSKLGSGLFGGWNERWFRLTGLGLFYYQNPKAPPKFGEHATTIDISQGKYFRTHKGVENAIEIVIGGVDERTFVLKANSLEDRNMWLKNLSDWQKDQRNANNIDPDSVVAKHTRVESFSSRLFANQGVTAMAALPVVAASAAPSSRAAPSHVDLQKLYPHSAAMQAASASQVPILHQYLVNNHELVVAMVRSWSAKGVREVEQPVVNALLGVAELTRTALPVLQACLGDEISHAQSELALTRASSGSNRLSTAFIRARGLSWLRAALRAPTTALFESPEEMEIDPARLANPLHVAVNCNALLKHCRQFVQQIVESANSADAELRQLVRFIHKTAEAKFPNSGHVGAVSLLFHRYLCPALLLPDQYRFMDSQASKRSPTDLRRRLTLVSKVIQNLASGAMFPAEDCMSVLNPFMEQTFQKFRLFVVAFCTPDNNADQFVIADRPFNTSEVLTSSGDINTIAPYLSDIASKVNIVTPATPVASTVSAAPAPVVSQVKPVVSLQALANSELHQRRARSDILSFCSPEFKGIIEVLLASDHRKAVEIAQALSASSEAKDIEKVATALLNVMDTSNSTVSFLSAVMTGEIDSTDSAGTLFRSTSIASRLIAHFMKMNATKWLRAAARESITEISASDSAFEIDPIKLGEVSAETLASNQQTLAGMCSKLMDQIFASAAAAPPVVREVSRQLFLLVRRKFPDAGHSAVGGLLFLRYLCPALLAPDQFNMYEVGYPNVVRKSSSVTRRFILIAKVIQNLANGIEFGGKEEYMGPLGVLLAPYASKMSNFIDAFVTPPYGDSFISEFREVTKAEVDCIEADMTLLKTKFNL